jgi:hypothetical protein
VTRARIRQLETGALALLWGLPAMRGLRGYPADEAPGA